MAVPRSSFLADVQTNINYVLQFADNWAALKTEFDTFPGQNITITDAYVQTVFPNMTAVQFNETLAAMQQVVDYIHDNTGTQPSRQTKLYRVKR